MHGFPRTKIDQLINNKSKIIKKFKSGQKYLNKLFIKDKRQQADI